MTRRGIEGYVVIVGIGFGALVVHRHIHVALPSQILDQRFRMNDLRDAVQLNRARRAAVAQGDLPIVSGLQRFRHFACDIVLLDEQLLVAFQRRDLAPFHWNRAAIIGLDKQFTAIEHTDLAG